MASSETNNATTNSSETPSQPETAQQALYRRVKQAQERRLQKRKRIHAH